MLELFVTAGQAASALLLLYGAFLVIVPARKASAAEKDVVPLGELRIDA